MNKKIKKFLKLNKKKSLDKLNFSKITLMKLLSVILSFNINELIGIKSVIENASKSIVVKNKNNKKQAAILCFFSSTENIFRK